MKPIRTGQKAEEQTVVFLRQRGYRILARNYRSPWGEIDIIAEDHGTLCFIEVKSRAHQDYGSPAEAVHRKKQQRIARTAAHYLQNVYGPKEVQCRFDVVAIISGTPPQLISDAFRLFD